MMFGPWSREAGPLVTPKGMGDLLPPEAAIRRTLSLRVLHSFELHGYELVTPPVFEHAEVVERGNDTLDSRDLLRFVEPGSGEVAVLRPDITPQVARIVALACEAPGASGRPISQWSTTELAAEIVRRGIVDEISPRHAARLLKRGISGRT